jgi:hypothetical protein
MNAKERNKLVRRLQKAARTNEQLAKGLADDQTQGKGKAYADGSAFAFRHAVRIVKGEVK